MTQKSIENDYFEWMYDLICGYRYTREHSFRKLLMHLHNVEFTYTIPKDANRARDGIDLRYRYAHEIVGDPSVESYIQGPCSVFEMMVALALRCEETIMDDGEVGDRTSQWFWKMIANLGLGSMLDRRFDEDYVNDILIRFLNREYEPDGRGGLFIIRNCRYDLRDVEIWNQLLEFINSIT